MSQFKKFSITTKTRQFLQNVLHTDPLPLFIMYYANANHPVSPTHLIYHHPIDIHFYFLAKMSFDMSTLRHIHAYTTPTPGKCGS